MSEIRTTAQLSNQWALFRGEQEKTRQLTPFHDEFDRWYKAARDDARRQALLDYADLLESSQYTLNYTDAVSMHDQIVYLMRRDAGLLYGPASSGVATEEGGWQRHGSEAQAEDEQGLRG